MTISPLDWAWDGAAVSRLPAARISSAVAIAGNSLMVQSPFSRMSVGERPDSEIAADVPPQAVQPLGLHDQEEDDEGAEHHQAEVGNEVEHGLRGEEDSAEGLHGVAADDRQQGHEDGPEHRAQHGAEAADDDHREVVDGHAYLELLVVSDAEEVRVQHPGHPGVEGRDGEREELVAEDVDADDLRGDVVIANGDEGAPYSRAHEVHGPHDAQDDEHQQEVVHVALAAEDDRAQARPRDLDRRLDAAADEGHVVDRPLY